MINTKGYVVFYKSKEHLWHYAITLPMNNNDLTEAYVRQQLEQDFFDYWEKKEGYTLIGVSEALDPWTTGKHSIPIKSFVPFIRIDIFGLFWVKI